MIVCKINTAKIDKALLFEGKSGKYLDIALLENRDGQDKYGNDGFVTQSATKEMRERGERGPIIGNWKEVGKGATLRQSPPAQNKPSEDDSGSPF